MPAGEFADDRAMNAQAGDVVLLAEAGPLLGIPSMGSLVRRATPTELAGILGALRTVGLEVSGSGRNLALRGADVARLDADAREALLLGVAAAVERTCQFAATG